jgi:hypothetical protein
MYGVHRRAVRFFWCTLIAASGASVVGNIADAVLAHPGHAPIAATAAAVPPAVLLGATHGVALLVRSRTHGATYWSALAMTVMLAGCAFVLSFDALRELALTWAGFAPATAWLWPVVIDLAIVQSTLALLALSGTPRRADGAHNGAPVRQNGVPLHDLGAPVHPPGWTAAAIDDEHQTTVVPDAALTEYVALAWSDDDDNTVFEAYISALRDDGIHHHRPRPLSTMALHLLPSSRERRPADDPIS